MLQVRILSAFRSGKEIIVRFEITNMKEHRILLEKRGSYFEAFYRPSGLQANKIAFKKSTSYGGVQIPSKESFESNAMLRLDDDTPCSFRIYYRDYPVKGVRAWLDSKLPDIPGGSLIRKCSGLGVKTFATDSILVPRDIPKTKG
jgi:hypothetical protein